MCGFGCSPKAFRPSGKRKFITKLLVFPFRLKTASWWLVRCVPKCVLWLQCEAHFLIGSDYGGITLICFAMTWMNMKICRDFASKEARDFQIAGKLHVDFNSCALKAITNFQFSGKLHVDFNSFTSKPVSWPSPPWMIMKICREAGGICWAKPYKERWHVYGVTLLYFTLLYFKLYLLSNTL